MNYKIIIFLISLCLMRIVGLDIDHAAIAAKAAGIQQAQVKKQQILESATKVGAVALCAYLAYYGYSAYHQKNNTLTITLSTDTELSAGVVKEALEQYAATKNSWMNGYAGGIAKFTGSLVLQSMVLQILQPLYTRIQHYFSNKVSVPVTRSWFLAEQQLNGADERDKKVEIAQELAECIMHIESVEYAYIHHQAETIKESARVILSHIIFVKEYETRYEYQKHILQKCYNTLTNLFQQMLHDAQNCIGNKHTLELFKEQIRQLHTLPAYSII